MSETERLTELHKLGSTHFWGNRQPLCPHCGAEYDISRHDHWELYNDNDTHECTCGGCGLPFTVHTHCSYSFSTDEQDE